MKPRSVAVLLFVLLALSIFATSAQAPRAVPPNDEFANAIAITPGKNYKVPDIGSASIDAGQPVMSASCNFAAVVNSVWYTVQLPRTGEIYLSTEGTVLETPVYTDDDTNMAVYTGSTIGTLSEVACNTGQAGLSAQISFTAAANTLYYIVVGTSTDPGFTPESVLKLTTRMTQIFVTVPNGSFETPLSPDDWKLKNPTVDAIVCSSGTYTAYSGLCTFMFTGGFDESSKLTQTIPFPTTFVPRKKGAVQVVFQFRVMDTGTIGSVKAKVTLSYKDGRPPSVSSINLTGQAAGVYKPAGRQFYLPTAKVASVKIDISFKAPAGTLLVDDAYILYSAPPSTRAAAALPPPVPAAH